MVLHPGPETGNPDWIVGQKIGQLILQKFNSIKYIENIKIVPPISRLCNTNFPQWQGTLRAELRADS